MLGIRSHISFEPISKAILWTWKQTQPKRSNPDEDITDRFHAIEIKDCPHRLKEVTTIMVYNFFFGNKQAQNTPQTQPIPGRESAMEKASDLNFGGTDASSAYNWMIKNKCYADVICFWTDCESWAGYKHPSQALAEYRQKVNPDAKAIYISLVLNDITLVDPKDPNSWDIAGFDPITPRLIQSIASGEL